MNGAVIPYDRSAVSLYNHLEITLLKLHAALETEHEQLSGTI
jgi:hypothetical protein